ncbi:MAG: TolC family protein [Candidatus Delongbacteria bacterium]|nr:TolC family protein [Candidatus Delongbacteria bacterium]
MHPTVPRRHTVTPNAPLATTGLRRTLLARVLLVLGVALAVPKVVRAAGQDSLVIGPAPSIETLVERALLVAPELDIAQQALEAARERVRPAAALADPQLELSGQAMDVPPGKASTVAVILSQPLPFPGKRAARRELARTWVTQQEIRLELARAKVVRDVRIQAARLYSLDQQAQVLELSGQLLQTAVRVAETRASTGAGEQETLLQLTIQEARIRQQQARIQAERSGELAALNRLLGWPVERRLAPLESLPAAVMQDPDSLLTGLELAPELRLRGAELESAHRNWQATRLEQKPDFMVGAGVGTNGMPEPMLMLKLGITLPLWSAGKQQALTRAAAHEESGAQAQLETERSRQEATLQQELAEWQRWRIWIIEYREVILPSSRLALDAALSAWAAGRGDFTRVIEDLNLVLDTGVQAAEAEAQALSSWARIEYMGPRATGPTTLE